MSALNVGYLESFRRLQGLSQSALAAKAGVSRQSIASWERGEQIPSLGQLAAVAQALGVSLEVFLEIADEPALSFRADQPRVLTPALKALVVKWAAAYAEIEQAVGEVALSPPQMQVDSYDPAAVEGYAGEVRAFLGVGRSALGDVIARLEDRGLKVLRISLPKQVSGFSAKSFALGSVIVVNERHPLARQSFSALHELAHLICHHQDYLQLIRAKALGPSESLANHLAAAVLLPREAVQRELGVYRGSRIPLAMLLDLQLRYSISVRTILSRAVQVGVITRTQRLMQLRVLNDLYGKRQESLELPGGYYRWGLNQEPLGPVKSRLERLVFQALGIEAITPSRAAEVLGVPQTYVRKRALGWSSG